MTTLFSNRDNSNSIKINLRHPDFDFHGAAYGWWKWKCNGEFIARCMSSEGIGKQTFASNVINPYPHIPNEEQYRSLADASVLLKCRYYDIVPAIYQALGIDTAAKGKTKFFVYGRFQKLVIATFDRMSEINPIEMVLTYNFFITPKHELTKRVLITNDFILPYTEEKCMELRLTGELE